MYMYSSKDIFTERPTECNGRDIKAKHLCPICGKNELKYEKAIPAVYVSPAPKDLSLIHI